MIYTKEFLKNKKCFVSSFGYTHSQNKPFDWFYKGNELNIIQSGSTISISQPCTNWGGYESEIITFHEFKNNIFNYIGFTLAADFTYTGMRKNYTNKKNISHIAPTVIGNKIFNTCIPNTINIHTCVMKNNKQMYQEYGFSGLKYIQYPINTLINNLYNIKNIFRNHELICTLLGASTNSASYGIKLTGSEHIKIDSSTLNDSVNFYTLN